MPQAEKPDSTTTSRRRFLAATAATAAAASIAATATSPTNAGGSSADGAENPALAALGLEFDRLLQIERDAWNAIPDDAPDSSWKPAELAHDDVAKVAEQIALLPALTLDGIRLKARIVAWCHSAFDEPVRYAQASSTTDERLAHSIIQDLLQRWSIPDEADHRSQYVTLMTADDQKTTGFEHVIWDTLAPIRSGDLIVVLPLPGEKLYSLARILRAERHDGLLAVGLDGTPMEPLPPWGMARVVQLMRSV